MLKKFTAGPWLVYVKGDLVAIGTKKTGKNVDKIVHWSGFDACGVSLDEQRANARLMAEAPAMLIALEGLLANLPITPTKGSNWYHAVKTARVVVARALS